jgi:hypothetical protein
MLEERVQVLGPEHPDTLTARHNRAYWAEKVNAETHSAA